MRLIAIANELLAIASHIDQVDPALEPADSHRGAERVANDPLPCDHPLWAELAREHYRSRRRRDKIFGSEALFGEPAWDILLDLFIAAKENRRVSVMSACIGAAVPSTTALRWITALEREQLLMREDDPVDARRTYVRLSPQGYAAMVDYFSAAAKTIKGSALSRLTEFERAERNAERGLYGPSNGNAAAIDARNDGPA
ncbi:MAG: MarR family winged helix-turn-helix transcriptional regulator [Novosphingobium sp.]